MEIISHRLRCMNESFESGLKEILELLILIDVNDVLESCFYLFSTFLTFTERRTEKLGLFVP